MKNLTLLSLGIFAITACINPKNSATESAEAQTETVQTIGGDRDEHGCLTAAGETWSELKQSCVQIFSIGQRLNPFEVNDNEAVISAFILFNDDQSKLELFLPDEKETILLDKGEDEVYQNETVKFDAKDSALYLNDELKYKG